MVNTDPLICLTNDLEGFTSSIKAEKQLNSFLSKSDAGWVASEKLKAIENDRKLRHHQIMNDRNSSIIFQGDLERQAASWRSHPNPRVRALLEYKSVFWSPRLTLSVLLSLPLGLLASWPSFVRAFTSDWEGIREAINEEKHLREKITVPFLNEIWISTLSLNSLAARELAMIFSADCDNEIGERLASVVQAIKYLEQYHSKKLVGEELYKQRDSLMEEARKTYNLEGTPDSWIEEILKNVK